MLSSDKVFIIAEAGVNHNGSHDIAKELIVEASKAGADAIKFQLFDASKVVTGRAAKAAYQNKNSPKDETQYDMLKKLELKENVYKELMDLCRLKDIVFFLSPFDLESINKMAIWGIEIFKIPSGEITNLPYLKKVGGYSRNVILSTGMSNLEEIGAAINVLVNSGTKKENITVLHCNTEYPTPFDDVNLRAMKSIGKTYGVKVGYSDHTIGLEVPVAAVTLGATVIEKHFTLDCRMNGPDHKASMEPGDFNRMVCAIRNVEHALGEGVKKLSSSEQRNKVIIRKSIVASRPIKQGETFTEENITTKRPAIGLSPMTWDSVVGKKSKRDFNKDEPIEL